MFGNNAFGALAMDSNASNAAGPSSQVIEGEELDVSWLKLVKRNGGVDVRVSEKIELEGLPNECNLMTVVNKWGLLIVGSNSDIRIHRLVDVHKVINEAPPGGKTLPEIAPVQTVSLPARPVWIRSAMNEERLVVATANGAGIFVWNLKDIIAGSTNPLHSFSTNIPSHLLNVLPNPSSDSLGRLVALVANEGLVMADIEEGKLMPPVAGPFSSACWSQKGKQILVGKPSGELVQYTPDGVAKAEIPHPPNLNHRPSSIQWLENDLVLVTYVQNAQSMDSDPIEQYIVSRKNGSHSFVKFFDPLNNMGFPARSEDYRHYAGLAAWGSESKHLAFLISGAAPDIAVMNGHPPSGNVPPQWEVLFLDGSERGTMPVAKAGRDNTSPLALGFDFTSQEPVQQSTDGTLPDLAPVPRLLTFSQEGVIISFDVLNPDAGPYPGMITPQDIVSGGSAAAPSPAPAATPASSTPKLAFGASSGSAFGQSGFGAAKPAAFGSSTFGSSPAFGQSSKPPSTAAPNAGSAFGQSAFGTAKPSGFGTSAFGQSPTPNASGASTPSGGASAFGSAPAFGNAAQPAASGQSAFGQAAKPSTFGSTTPSAFGQSSTPSAFGQSAFGQSAFGQSSKPASPAPSAFGSSPSAFGQANKPASPAPSSSSQTSAFGSSATQAPAFSGFGKSGTPSTASPAFGQSAFGQKPATGTGSAFGAGGGFGQSAFGQKSAFGAGNGSAFGQSAFGKPAVSPSIEAPKPVSAFAGFGQTKTETPKAPSPAPSPNTNKDDFGLGGFASALESSKSTASVPGLGESPPASPVGGSSKKPAGLEDDTPPNSPPVKPAAPAPSAFGAPSSSSSGFFKPATAFGNSAPSFGFNATEKKPTGPTAFGSGFAPAGSTSSIPSPGSAFGKPSAIGGGTAFGQQSAIGSGSAFGTSGFGQSKPASPAPSASGSITGGFGGFAASKETKGFGGFASKGPSLFGQKKDDEQKGDSAFSKPSSSFGTPKSTSAFGAGSPFDTGKTDSGSLFGKPTQTSAFTSKPAPPVEEKKDDIKQEATLIKEKQEEKPPAEEDSEVEGEKQGEDKLEKEKERDEELEGFDVPAPQPVEAKSPPPASAETLSTPAKETTTPPDTPAKDEEASNASAPEPTKSTSPEIPVNDEEESTTPITLVSEPSEPETKSEADDGKDKTVDPDEVETLDPELEAASDVSAEKAALESSEGASGDAVAELLEEAQKQRTNDVIENEHQGVFEEVGRDQKPAAAVSGSDGDSTEEETKEEVAEPAADEHTASSPEPSISDLSEEEQDAEVSGPEDQEDQEFVGEEEEVDEQEEEEDEEEGDEEDEDEDEEDYSEDEEEEDYEERHRRRSTSIAPDMSPIDEEQELDEGSDAGEEEEEEDDAEKESSVKPKPSSLRSPPAWFATKSSTSAPTPPEENEPRSPSPSSGSSLFSRLGPATSTPSEEPKTSPTDAPKLPFNFTKHVSRTSSPLSGPPLGSTTPESSPAKPVAAPSAFAGFGQKPTDASKPGGFGGFFGTKPAEGEQKSEEAKPSLFGGFGQKSTEASKPSADTNESQTPASTAPSFGLFGQPKLEPIKPPAPAAPAAPAGSLFGQPATAPVAAKTAAQPKSVFGNLGLGKPSGSSTPSAFSAKPSNEPQVASPQSSPLPSSKPASAPAAPKPEATPQPSVPKAADFTDLSAPARPVLAERPSKVTQSSEKTMGSVAVKIVETLDEDLLKLKDVVASNAKFHQELRRRNAGTVDFDALVDVVEKQRTLPLSQLSQVQRLIDELHPRVVKQQRIDEEAEARLAELRSKMLRVDSKVAQVERLLKAKKGQISGESLDLNPDQAAYRLKLRNAVQDTEDKLQELENSIASLRHRNEKQDEGHASLPPLERIQRSVRSVDAAIRERQQAINDLSRRIASCHIASPSGNRSLLTSRRALNFEPTKDTMAEVDAVLAGPSETKKKRLGKLKVAKLNKPVVARGEGLSGVRGASFTHESVSAGPVMIDDLPPAGHFSPPVSPNIAPAPELNAEAADLYLSTLSSSPPLAQPAPVPATSSAPTPAVSSPSAFGGIKFNLSPSFEGLSHESSLRRSGGSSSGNSLRPVAVKYVPGAASSGTPPPPAAGMFSFAPKDGEKVVTDEKKLPSGFFSLKDYMNKN
ncbi:hypothetical protein B9479_001088 [Cryptococcus floricola]|uniref:Nucleoporin Nup159/Nup146 N-terminal domain-containing protein n=1 Tax=Cryptococcus floricola TaxID=2591691 RepID=A0A5D3B5K1_9TREE|nr:hypothetical protein B9479_001088 [Cryptococcus floricola]